jgi:hypothetical protein
VEKRTGTPYLEEMPITTEATAAHEYSQSAKSAWMWLSRESLSQEQDREGEPSQLGLLVLIVSNRVISSEKVDDS